MHYYKEETISVNDQSNQGYGKACPTPKYIATEIALSTMTLSSSHLSLASLLTQARDKYGSGVTIQNVHWDLLDGVRVSATYDVITCVEAQGGIMPVRK